MKYVCNVCGWIYDEMVGDADNGIAPNTLWKDLPEDFVCPLCGVSKEDFSEEQSKYKTKSTPSFRCAFCFYNSMFAKGICC